MDHDRSEGEALGPQEYTGVKMEVVNWSGAAAAELEGKLNGRKVYLVAATLRPETMYGQTNCFVGPELKYGVYAVNEQEAFVCTHRAARNMLYQGVFTPKGEVKDVNDRKLADLVVLDADPTVDIRNTDKVHRVMLGGRLYDAATLNETVTGTRVRAPFWWERGGGYAGSPAVTEARGTDDGE